MNYIIIKNRKDFKPLMKKYNSKWKAYLWDTFQDETCYIPEKDCFISLQKAKEVKFTPIT